MISFRRKIESSIYLNPFLGFEPQEGKVEIRWDPLTNLTARLVHFPPRKIERFDFQEAVSSSLAAKCPFCQENAESMTARLDKTVFGCECLQYGEVRIIPNLLTFDKYSLVAIISKDHYVDMRGLAHKDSIGQGIRALLNAFTLLKEKDRKVKYFSLNCNYMPMSGGSLIHPHMHGIAGEHPTNYHRIMLEKSRNFYRNNKKVFWNAYIQEEKRLKERYIGEAGKTVWYTPFAPKGNIDIGCIFHKSTFFSLDKNEWDDFSRGIGKVLMYLDNENIAGFNLTIFSGLDEREDFRVNARIIARRFLPPVNAADVNYLEKIHMESACLVFPEAVASHLRETW